MSATVANPVSGSSGIREIVCGLRHDFYARLCVTVLKAFVDDSGSGGDSPWYVLAGYIGTAEAWDSFEGEWLLALKEPSPKLEYFKASEAESLRPDGQWAGVNEEDRDSKLDALIGVIQNRARIAIHLRAKQADYDEVVRGAVAPKFDNPYFFLFGGIITAMVGMVKNFGQNEPIEFVFDSMDRKRFENPSLLVYGELQNRAYFSGRIANVLYRDDKAFLPLQAADLLAWQVRRAFCPSVPTEPRRRHFDTAQQCAQPPFSYEMTRKDLLDWVADMDRAAIEHALSLGISLEDLQAWRRKKP